MIIMINFGTISIKEIISQILKKHSLVTFILLFISIGSSCQLKNDELATHFFNIRKINKNIPPGEWKTILNYPAFGKEFYQMCLEKEDSIYNLEFNVKKSEDSVYEYKIIRFSKEYSDNKYYFELLMDSDTIYFYKAPLTNLSKKIFTVGKYYYMYATPEGYIYPLCQRKFFRSHRDSLIKVRGNNLPELPCEE